MTIHTCQRSQPTANSLLANALGEPAFGTGWFTSTSSIATRCVQFEKSTNDN